MLSRNSIPAFGWLYGARVTEANPYSNSSIAELPLFKFCVLRGWEKGLLPEMHGSWR